MTTYRSTLRPTARSLCCCAGHPASGASVLSRGIVGTRGGVPFVASPMHKQPYRLSDGVCLDDEAVRVPTYAVRVVDGVVQVGPRRS